MKKSNKNFRKQFAPPNLGAIKVVLVALLAIAITSCNEQYVADVKNDGLPNTSRKADAVDIDTARHRVAKAIAIGMNQNQDLREFVDSLASRQEAGDFNFLYELSKDAVIGSKTLSEHLADYSQWSTAYFADSIEPIDPTMVIQVYYPNGDSTSWSTASFAPSVAIWGDQQDDSIATYSAAYQNDGSFYRIRSTTPSSDVHVVVKESERIIALNKNTGVTWSGWDISQLTPCKQDCFDAYAESDDNKFIKLEVLLNCLIACDDGGSGGGGGQGTCDRDQDEYKDEKEEMVKWKFESRNDEQYAMGAMGWLWEGKVEMRAVYVFHSGGTSNGSYKAEAFFRNNRSEYHCTSPTNCPWMYENHLTIDFDDDEHGDRYKIEWIEVDKKDFSASINVSFSVEVKGVTAGTEATIKYSPKDERMGSQFVEYCDDADLAGTIYSTGGIVFNTRVEH